ncbi:MAG: peptidase T4 [Ponticaulis sp.]|nr:peptidase T4 [Ponticaulis sp.]
MAKPGLRNLITDVAGLKVGHAEDMGVSTGCTVILPERRAVCAVHVAGGGPGTRETDALKAGTLVDEVDAIVLSGGSVYGLAAADGVAAELGALGRGFAMREQAGVPVSPVVPSAILYDLANGGDKTWGREPPYNALGRKAVLAASEACEIGRVGAGTGAIAGQAQGGTGSASSVTDDGYTVGALVAVNSFGSVRVPGSDAFWAAPYEIDQEFGGIPFPSGAQFDPEDWGAAKLNPSPRENTTIACIATDAALTPSETQRLADMAIAGMARAIRPVFAPFDGDVVFALATGDKPVTDPRPLLLARLGDLAASTLSRAIARGVYAAGAASSSQLS